MTYKAHGDMALAIADAPQPDVIDPSEVEYSLSSGIAARLAALNLSLAFTSYQSGVLYFFGPGEAGAHLHQSGLPKPMGLCFESPDRFTLAMGAYIARFQNILQPDERANGLFDACFVPRALHLTGDVDAHDLGVDSRGRPIFVNTRYNCLATVSDLQSFEFVWKPPFISGLLDGDKCHMNGLAMDAGEPAYVTCVSRSDVIDGWRDRRASGGVVVDVRSNRIVCEGLSMPHSPRWRRGELWLLNAGTGELGVVEGLASGRGRFAPRAFCPGFLRGLAIYENLAFVGLSKPRYKRFEGLDLDRRLYEADAEPWCGVQVIDLATGGCVDWLRIDGAVAELYDVAVLPGHHRAMALPPFSAETAGLVTYRGA